MIKFIRGELSLDQVINHGLKDANECVFKKVLAGDTLDNCLGRNSSELRCQLDTL